MDKLIFRREDEDTEKQTNTLNKLFTRKRRYMKPLMSLFSENEKTILIKHLFNRDRNLFYSFMDELELRVIWNEAFALMETELRKRKIDIFSEKAKIMTDRIYQAFYPDDISIG